MWLKLNRYLARVLLSAAGSRFLLSSLALGVTISGTVLLELTTGKAAIEAFVAALLAVPSFHLETPVLAVILLLLALFTLANAFHRYRIQLLQRALGRLYIDGKLEGATLQRAIRLEQFANDGTEGPCRLDVVALLFPAPDEENPPEEGSIEEWLRNAAYQPDSCEMISPFQPNQR